MGEQRRGIMATSSPVFYDCEASDLEGYPIEIGWAFTEVATSAVASESHLIKPPAEWPVKESWDRSAERLHGIALVQLSRDGRPVWEVAQRMNAALEGMELFSDSSQDERWLRILFDAAGFEPTFTISRTDAAILISQAAADCGLDEAAYWRTNITAAELAPRRHPAEADARHLAVFWNIIAQGSLAS